jgi:predicted MarR family transcription regulator
VLLGLRRATVSIVCSKLQDLGIIEYSRGAVAVTARTGLKQHVCECYFRIRRESLLRAEGCTTTRPRLVVNHASALPRCRRPSFEAM